MTIGAINREGKVSIIKDGQVTTNLKVIDDFGFQPGVGDAEKIVLVCSPAHVIQYGRAEPLPPGEIESRMSGSTFHIKRQGWGQCSPMEIFYFSIGIMH